MVNVNRVSRIQKLINAYNKAERELRKSVGTTRYNKANNNYYKTYKNLKKELGVSIRSNNNNLYPNMRPSNVNFGLSFNSWSHKGNARNVMRPIRAATTIQRHVRGTQLRNRAGAHNPTKPVGYLLQMLRMKRQARSN
jgi:hypothetical protein